MLPTHLHCHPPGPANLPTHLHSPNSPQLGSCVQLSPPSTLPTCQRSFQELNLELKVTLQSCCLKPQCSPAPQRAKNMHSKVSEFCRAGPPPALQT